jgi:hypothetical protein
MMKPIVCLVSILFLLQVCPASGIGRVTVTSSIPGELFLDGVSKGPIQPGETFVSDLKEPGPHLLEVRGTKTNLVHREEFSIDPSSGENRTVQAFFASPSPGSPPPEVVPDPTVSNGTITREEMNAAIDQASRKAKAEVLAEEAARRRRAQKREITTRAITHVVAVEGRRLPSGVKAMERIKLLGELVPLFGKGR